MTPSWRCSVRRLKVVLPQSADSVEKLDLLMNANCSWRSKLLTQVEGIEMMGRQEVAQSPLFYSFNLDAHIPSNHLLRGIDRFLDLGELHAHLAPHYSNTGRPSIDPTLLIRMLVVGYCFGIRSERQLCEEVHLNLAYRWFCRLGLEDQGARSLDSLLAPVGARTSPPCS